MRRPAAFVALVLALAIVPGTAFAAVADPVAPTEAPPVAPPTDLSPAEQAQVREEAPLVEAADALTAVAEGRPGFGGISLKDGALVLRWKGAPPAAVTSTIKRLGVPVRVLPATYSRAELESAARAIVREIEAGRGNGVNSVTLAADGSGLRLGVSPRSTTPGSGRVAAEESAFKAAAARTAAAAGVDVPITVDEQDPIAPLSRMNDFPPWAGGIVVKNRTSASPYFGQGCTGGFGVKAADSKKYLVTASHCGRLNDAVSDGVGESIGTVKYRDHDSGVDLISATSVSGSIYSGAGANQTGQYITNVFGWNSPYVGQSGLCASAAITGYYCGLSVYERDAYRCAPDPESIPVKCWFPLYGLRRVNGQRAAQNGDSGGPVYTLTSTAKAYIHGIIIGGQESGSPDVSLVWILGSTNIHNSFPSLNLTIATK